MTDDPLSLAERLETEANAEDSNAYTVDLMREAAKALRQMAAPGWRPIVEHDGGAQVVDLWGCIKGQMLPAHRITDCQWRLAKEKSGLLVRYAWLTNRDEEVEADYFSPLPAAPDTGGEPQSAAAQEGDR